LALPGEVRQFNDDNRLTNSAFANQFYAFRFPTRLAIRQLANSVTILKAMPGAMLNAVKTECVSRGV
jgi:hypothetical protein